MAKEKIELISFRQTLAVAGLVGSRITMMEYAPFNGYIRQVSIHWPGGCNALVQIRVGLNLEQFCPRENYLALDNVTPVYSFNKQVKERGEIWVEMINGDGAWPHTTTVTVTVVEEPEV